MSIRITNIQHFSLHDGSGIRTTVFLKGCNLRCPWCCNPENINYEIENNIGYNISLDDLEEEILKDEIYYNTGGGVTFSGGEPLLQAEKLEPLLKRLKDNNINICVETALQVPSKFVKIVLPYLDEIFIDIKILDKKESKTILNGDSELYYKNLNLINLDKVTFRIPLCEEFTLKEENINNILNLIKKYPEFNVEIFKVHNLAENKYELINKKPTGFSEVSDEKINEIYRRIKIVNENVSIIKI